MKIINNFDGLRLVAALAVVTSHEFWIAGHTEPEVFGDLTLGGVALVVFFAISGYLVASSWAADPKLWRFAVRRILRIWPAYVVVVVGAALWIGWTDPRPLANAAAWMYVDRHLVFRSFEWDFFWRLRDPRLNASIWTIPFELGCYVAFACVALVFRKSWPLFLAIAGSAAFAWWASGMASINPSSVSLATDAVYFGAFFGAGAVLHGLPLLRTPKASAVLLLAGILAFAAGSQVMGLALSIPTIAIFVGTRSWPVLRRAGRFGDFSYGLYLWAWPVQQVVATHLGVQAGFWRLLPVSLAGAMVLAVVSWHLVEKRALAAKPSSTTTWPRALTLELN